MLENQTNNNNFIFINEDYYKKDVFVTLVSLITKQFSNFKVVTNKKNIIYYDSNRNLNISFTLVITNKEDYDSLNVKYDFINLEKKIMDQFLFLTNQKLSNIFINLSVDFI